MSNENPPRSVEGRSRGGCCLIQVAAIAVVVGLIIFALGYDPRVAAGVGVASGFGCVAAPLVVVLGVVAVAVVLFLLLVLVILLLDNKR